MAAVTDEVVKWYKEQLKEEAGEARDLLLQHRDEIIASVREVRELSEIDLGQSALAFSLGGGNERERLDIDRVISLDFVAIDSAVWKDRKEPVSRILFKIDCTARVVASPQAFYWSAGPIFPIGGEKQQTPFWDRHRREPPSEREIPVQPYGEAHFKKVDDNWNLISVKVEKSFSDEWLKAPYPLNRIHLFT